jgi:hypothetical protein
VKNILLYIPSRNKPEFLDETFQKVFSTAKDLTNFDILCHIDTDQIELYDSVIKKYPNVIWQYVIHSDTSWFNMVKLHHDFINKNKYYFHWHITDDSVKNNLTNHWDDIIIKTKKKFDDDLFVLYTNSTVWNRQKIIHENCYYVQNSDTYNGKIIYNRNEMLPIWTYKFIEFMWDIVKNGDYSSSRELLTSSIIYKLYKEYNLNRHVWVDVVYSNVSKIDGVIDRSCFIKNSDGLNRNQSFYKLVCNNFKEIMPVVKNMYYYIQELKESK